MRLAAIDPSVALRGWRSSLYWGNPADVDRFLDATDATLPLGWVRDSGHERGRPRPDRIRCYLSDQLGDAPIRVWLQRVTANRVRGGPVQLLRHPPSGDTGRTGRLVAEFMDGCVIPAARAAGVRVTRPAFGPRSAVTPVAEMLFTRLADAVDGEWPRAERAQGLWDELVSNCLTEAA